MANMRASYIICLVAMLSLHMARGQKELARVYIEGNDLCPQVTKQPAAAAPQTTTERGALSRIFSRNQAPAPPPAPACTPIRYCGTVETVLQRCKTTPGCKAVSYDGKCGLLKTATEPRRGRPGWSTYPIAMP